MSEVWFPFVAIVICVFFFWRRIYLRCLRLDLKSLEQSLLEIPDALYNQPFRLFSARFILRDVRHRLRAYISQILSERNEYRAILSSMTEGVLTVDTQGQIDRLNEAAVNLLQLNPQISRGRSVHEAIRHPQMQKFILQAVANQGTSEKEVEWENGRFLRVRGAALYDSDGEKQGGVFVFGDVTEAKRLQNYRQEFVSNVSHELRTPLTSIQGYAETLLHMQIDENKRKHFLEIINHHCIHLGAIIDDLLSLSEMDRGTGDFHRETLSLTELIEGVLMLFPKERLGERRLAVNNQCEASQTLYVNRVMVERALANLLSNALKYSLQDVSLLVAFEENCICFTVKDRGDGIAPGDLSRIFERFYRTDQAREQDGEGVGLGLALVKHIAMVHGGHVDVDSVLEQGSSFHFYLPV